MTPSEIISLKIAELQAAILASHPTMPTLLRDIHKNLLLDPEIVTILKPEQVAVIINGLSKQTNTIIMAEIVSGKKGKAASKISADDV